MHAPASVDQRDVTNRTRPPRLSSVAARCTTRDTKSEGNRICPQDEFRAARFHGDESGKGSLMIFSQGKRLRFSWLVRAGLSLFGLLCAALPGKTQTRRAFRPDRG